MSDYEQRPSCPKCKRELENYFDHTQFDCKNMTETQLEEEMLLRKEYRKYCNQFTGKNWTIGGIMSFDDWCRAMADNEMDKREGK